MQHHPARMILAPEIYALVGSEINVYFDALVPALNPYTDIFEVQSEVGSLLA